MLHLLPLGEIDAAQIVDLLADERAAWERELGWDYGPTASLVSQAVASRTFSGFALCDRRRAIAYGYFLPDPVRSLLGAFHALPEAEAEPGGAVPRLLRHSFEHLTGTVGTRRIESQFLYFGQEDPWPSLGPWKVARFPREFLDGPLGDARRLLGPPGGPGLRPFRPHDRKAAALVVYKSFIGSVDAEMSQCYRTPEACDGFLDGVLNRNGCGTVELGACYLHERGRVADGVVLASRIGPGNAHIVQISVAPDDQGRGIGRQLLAAAVDSLLGLGYARLSLTVSLGNARARDWYRSLGLAPRKRFDALLWERPGRNPAYQ